MVEHSFKKNKKSNTSHGANTCRIHLWYRHVCVSQNKLADASIQCVTIHSVGCCDHHHRGRAVHGVPARYHVLGRLHGTGIMSTSCERENLEFLMPACLLRFLLSAP